MESDAPSCRVRAARNQRECQSPTWFNLPRDKSTDRPLILRESRKTMMGTGAIILFRGWPGRSRSRSWRRSPSTTNRRFSWSTSPC